MQKSWVSSLTRHFAPCIPVASQELRNQRRDELCIGTTINWGSNKTRRNKKSQKQPRKKKHMQQTKEPVKDNKL